MGKVNYQFQSAPRRGDRVTRREFRYRIGDGPETILTADPGDPGVDLGNIADGSKIQWAHVDINGPGALLPERTIRVGTFVVREPAEEATAPAPAPAPAEAGQAEPAQPAAAPATAPGAVGGATPQAAPQAAPQATAVPTGQMGPAVGGTTR